MFMKTITKNQTKNKQIKINEEYILISNNKIRIPSGTSKLSKDIFGTILSNLAYYGYTLSKNSLNSLITLSDNEAKSWWKIFEPEFKKITGDNKNMDNFVVYKNFPKEVLNMSEAEYWIKQILMYVGLPNELFTEEEEIREPLNDELKLKVLHLADDNTLLKIFNNLLLLPSSWVIEQENIVMYLANNNNYDITLSDIVFKENMIKLAINLFNSNLTFTSKSATDVLRLAVGLSSGDISLKTNSKFRNFKRSERRFLLNLLENSSNLEDDLSRYPNKWKKLLSRLHPNEKKGKYPNVSLAYDLLYNNNLTTFNSKLENYITNRDVKALDILKTRVGVFTRKLQEVIKIYGKDGVDAYLSILDKLSVIQLLKINSYINSINSRKFRTIAPKGNWNKLQILDNTINISNDYIKLLTDKINKELSYRIKEKGIKTVNLSEDTKMIKLQTNDSELSSYGRGTEFPIPENINFIRTASYWEKKSSGNVWFDNGWNFFNENWESKGFCTWDFTSFGSKSAIFSGDPTNSKEMKGRGCQLIDLYIDKLINNGVRYAVWNILCYSHIPFSKANDVFAALQWGEEPQKGKLFEPSRCQLSFPVDGDSLTKYIAYIDLVERKLVYLDANLRGDVSSARRNSGTLSKVMPAFVEYLNTLPSVYDLFKNTRKHKKGTSILYTDEDVEIKNGKKAYIFKPVNENNDYVDLNLSKLLN